MNMVYFTLPCLEVTAAKSHPGKEGILMEIIKVKVVNDVTFSQPTGCCFHSDATALGRTAAVVRQRSHIDDFGHFYASAMYGADC